MIGHLLALGVLAFIEKRRHFETGFRGCALNVRNHGIQRSERVASPLHANKTEQPMLDRIPLRGAGRIVADRNRDPVGSGNCMVQAVFPKARPVSIAASAVTQQQDFLHTGVGGPADFRYPCLQAVHCKLRSVRGGTDHDRSAIPNRLVKPVGRSDGRCLTTEIVLVDEFRISTPGSSLISEVADELLLLGVHAQDGAAGILESLPEVGDQLELSVAVRMLGLGDAFSVDSKRVLSVLEQLARSIGAEAHPMGSHFLTDRARVFPAPLLVTHGIAGRVRLHQFVQECHHVVFF